MKAAIIGYGKMGKLIAEEAPNFDITISSIIDRKENQKELSQTALQNCDIAFDFCSSENIMDRVKLCLQTKVPLIIGTTGWENELEYVKNYVQQHKGTVMFSPNFSIGVHLFFELVSYAAKLFSSFDDYDVSCIELHHKMKKDFPSGTAKEIARILLENIPRKKQMISNLPEGAIHKDHLHVASVRSGFHPGKHEVAFDNPDGTITLKHEARTRNDFAKGALLCAKWLMNKKGFFTMNDFLKEYTNAH